MFKKRWVWIVALFLVINIAGLFKIISVLENKTANGWATWKERTPFMPGPLELHAHIESLENDNRKNAIQYLLLHEIGHVLASKLKAHPPWGIRPDALGTTGDFTFFNESWFINGGENKFESKFDHQFPERTKTVYYFVSNLENAQMTDVYSQLEKTNFVTLYSVTHFSDDWAEAFATYVHSVLMKKPFRVTIKKDGKVVKTFELCWDKPRCRKKREILNRLFAGS